MEDSDYEENDEGEVFKKKEKTSDYGKVAKALGEIISRGIKISLVDINKSSFSFKPDIENHEILFGLKALGGINSETIDKIIAGRPYSSLKDFMQRCPLNKTAMFSLIKAGAFDKIEAEMGRLCNVEPRVAAMAYYISQVSEPKKRLTLQNLNGLIQHNLLPQDLDFQQKVFNFNKYLKSNKKVGKYYSFDDMCSSFYNKYFDPEKLEVINGVICILQTVWDKIYQGVMDEVRDWLKDHHDEMLQKYNTLLFKEMWDKYAKGSLSSWEMESLCFYYHGHELKDVDTKKYGLSDFFELPTEPIVEKVFTKKGKEIPIYKIDRIIGTVINKNDVRSSISLLTTKGVVNVKFTKEYYAMFNRQISQRQADGTKKVLEKGWFTRGTKVMCTGFRRDDMFITKTYANTSTHQLYKIVEIKDNGEMVLEHERAKGDEEDV